MNLPGFTAEVSLYNMRAGYSLSGRFDLQGNAVIPAIPFCGNCDYILENCEKNGWRPRAVCNACDAGNCFSGVENPPEPPPWEWRPRWQI